MPLYFAYGSNMDADAMRERCPRSTIVDTARLARHRFVIMGNGWASVVRDPTSEVHGVLFDLALSDVPALDRYEDVAHGLYTKSVQPVHRASGHPCQATVYFGTDETTDGPSPAGYRQGILAAGRAAGLPDRYIAALERYLSSSGPGLARGRS